MESSLRELLSRPPSLTLAFGACILLCLLQKFRLALWGFLYFFASSDKKANKPADTKFDFSDPRLDRVKVVFIRHGESEWNWVFNKGPILLRPLRFVLSLAREFGMLLQQDSLFLDSPLSATGIQQAWDLLTFFGSQKECCLKEEHTTRPVEDLEIADLVHIIIGEVGRSTIVSSILRRAISTGVIALSLRLLKTPAQDKMLLMTALQEISRNVDTLALTPKDELPQAPGTEAHVKNMGDVVSHLYRTRMDKSLNSGNKSLAQKAKHRQDDFTDWIFKEKSKGSKVDTVIVCGHSLWFREFFKSYLPKGAIHKAKQYKMVNCGVVAFDLYRRPQKSSLVCIKPESIKEIYGGFEVKDKNKKL